MFVSMSWTHGPQDFSKLNALGSIVARLMRLSLFDKIQRGEAQLVAQGLPPGLSELYKEHAIAERYTLIPQKDEILEVAEDLVKVTTTERSTF
jgi:hypothetical protein